jgi:hypothetical protein
MSISDVARRGIQGLLVAFATIVAEQEAHAFTHAVHVSDSFENGGWSFYTTTSGGRTGTTGGNGFYDYYPTGAASPSMLLGEAEDGTHWLHLYENSTVASDWTTMYRTFNIPGGVIAANTACNVNLYLRAYLTGFHGEIEMFNAETMAYIGYQRVDRDWDGRNTSPWFLVSFWNTWACSKSIVIRITEESSFSLAMNQSTQEVDADNVYVNWVW